MYSMFCYLFFCIFFLHLFFDFTTFTLHANGNLLSFTLITPTAEDKFSDMIEPGCEILVFT